MRRLRAGAVLVDSRAEAARRALARPIHDDPWRELCGRVWDHWVGETWRHRVVRRVMPGLAVILDRIVEAERSIGSFRR